MDFKAEVCICDHVVNLLFKQLRIEDVDTQSVITKIYDFGFRNFMVSAAFA